MMKQSKTREMLIEQFLKSLSENPINWQKVWFPSVQFNPITDTHYNGINRFLLGFIAEKNHYDDPRWMTFNQIKKNDYKLEAGTKGVPVEFCQPYDFKKKKNITFEELEKAKKDKERAKEVGIMVKVYYVFNAKHIKGLEPYVAPASNFKESLASSVFENYLKHENIEHFETGSSAYYDFGNDTITTPTKNQFYGEEEYYAVLGHEIAHSTGAQNRLNRDLVVRSDVQKYAIEELKAEIASSFLSAELNIPLSDFVMNNHKAYVQNWISIIKEKPSALFSAIKDADKITAFVKEKGNYAEELKSLTTENENISTTIENTEKRKSAALRR